MHSAALSSGRQPTKRLSTRTSTITSRGTGLPCPAHSGLHFRIRLGSLSHRVPGPGTLSLRLVASGRPAGECHRPTPTGVGAVVVGPCRFGARGCHCALAGMATRAVRCAPPGAASGAATVADPCACGGNGRHTLCTAVRAPCRMSASRLPAGWMCPAGCVGSHQVAIPGCGVINFFCRGKRGKENK